MWRSKLRCNLGAETEIHSKAANRKQSQPATPSKGLEGRGMVTSAYQGTLRSKHLETHHEKLAALCLQTQSYQEEQQQKWPAG